CLQIVYKLYNDNSKVAYPLQFLKVFKCPQKIYFTKILIDIDGGSTYISGIQLFLRIFQKIITLINIRETPLSSGLFHPPFAGNKMSSRRFIVHVIGIVIIAKCSKTPIIMDIKRLIVTIVCTITRSIQIVYVGFKLRLRRKIYFRRNGG